MKLGAWGMTDEKKREERVEIEVALRSLIWNMADLAQHDLSVMAWRTGFNDDIAIFAPLGTIDVRLPLSSQIGVRLSLDLVGRFDHRYANVNLHASTRVSKWSLSVEAPRRVSWARLGDAEPAVLLAKVRTILEQVKAAYREAAAEAARRKALKDGFEAELGFPLRSDTINFRPEGAGLFKVDIAGSVTVEQARAIRGIVSS